VRRRLVLKLLRLQPRNLGAELAILVRRLRNEGSKLSSCSADWDVAGALVQYCDNRSSCNGGSISGWGGLLAQEEARRAIEAHTHKHHHRTCVSRSLLFSFSPSFARISGAARVRSHMAASSTRRMSTRLASQASCSCGAQRREWAGTTRSASCAPLPSSSAQQPPPRRRPRRHIIGVFNILQSRPVHERLA